MLRTEENWDAIQEQATLEDGDPDLVDQWTSVCVSEILSTFRVQPKP